MDGNAERKPPIESVNFHVWLPCNMRCNFCFGRFEDVRLSVLPRGHLPRDDALRLVRAVALAGFEKITFAGGEPMLCPWLPELVVCASDSGMTTCVVTNGSLLSERRMAGFMGSLDWVALSFDSADATTLQYSGRAVGRRPMGENEYMRAVEIARASGCSIKINTVVSAHNMSEDLSHHIVRLRPDRWKILQVLRIAGQNDQNFAADATTLDEFEAFVDRHKHLVDQGITIVPEDNSAMTGSYAMIDPAGRFFDNVEGRYRYSSPILDRGVSAAFSEIRVSREKYVARGGLYEWAS